MGKNLIELAKELDFSSQNILVDLENELADQYEYNVFDKFNNNIRKFILLTSIPYTIGKNINFELKQLWFNKCTKCHSVLNNRLFLSTGNLRPKIIVVGDAPSAFGGLFEDRTNEGLTGRVWVDKQSSIILRKALDLLGLHHVAWYTNLLKCSMINNIPSTTIEIKNCAVNIINEINLLKPKIALLLGNHVNENWSYEMKSYKVFHPSYIIRINKDYRWYANHIKEVLS